jgi:hypothetical protein
MTKKLFISIFASILFLAANAFAQTSAFVYQGKLNDGTLAANGTYQFEFKLYDSAAVGAGNQIGNTLSNVAATVSNGIFSTTLDFGANSFDGAARFLEISVRLENSGQNYTPLSPRQPISATPYAVRSLKAEQANTANLANDATQLGSIPAAQYVQTNDSRMTDARSPLPFSGYYIQNGTGLQASSNFNVSGEGKANVFSALTQFNIGANRVLSIGGVNNAFVGVNAGNNNTGSNNAFFGQIAGVSNTSGSFNTALGTGAGDNNSTGSNNTFVGYLAGQANTVENDNTFIGYKAFGGNGITNSTAIGANAFVGTSNTMVLGTNLVTVQVPGSLTVAGTFSANILNASTQYNLGGNRFLSVAGTNNTIAGLSSGTLNTGTNNSFFGKFTGAVNSTGSFNSFFGTNAGAANTTGGDNSFFGQGAGFKNTEGSNNTANGSGAGLNNTTGDNNTFLGQLAGLSNTAEDNNTFLGYKTNGAVGITNATAIGANAVVTTSNTMVLGTNSVTVFAPGSFNTTSNYKIGGNRVFHLTGTDNTFVGFEAGNSIAPEGTYNAFFGAYSGKFTTTGINNAFFGSYSGRANTTGNNNSFVGNGAGLSNTTGALNSFFGSAAGSSNLTGASNSFFGTLSGVNSESGSNNSFFGYKTGETTTSGSNNTFFGALSGAVSGNGAGSNNTAIGYNNKFGAGVSNSVAIGANLVVNASNNIVIGDNSSLLTVRNISAASIKTASLDTDLITSNYGLFDYLKVEGDARVTDDLTIDSDLDVSGKITGVEIVTSGSIVSTLKVVAPIVQTSNLKSTSAEMTGITTIQKLKYINLESGGTGTDYMCIDEYNDILRRCFAAISAANKPQDFRGGLSVINSFRAVTFTTNEGRQDVGLVSNESNPNELFVNRKDNGEQKVRYNQVVPALVSAAQEQQTQISDLKEQIKEQKAQIEALKALVCTQNTNAAVCQPLKN